jgi:uncharacterized membrane protein
MDKWHAWRRHLFLLLFPIHSFGDMSEMNEQFPKSTLLLGTAFWAVLVALMAWTLSSTVQTQNTLSAMASAQNYEQRRIDSLDATLIQHDGRLRVLEVQEAHR